MSQTAVELLPTVYDGMLDHRTSSTILTGIVSDDVEVFEVFFGKAVTTRGSALGLPPVISTLFGAGNDFYGVAIQCTQEATGAPYGELGPRATAHVLTRGLVWTLLQDGVPLASITNPVFVKVTGSSSDLPPDNAFGGFASTPGPDYENYSEPSSSISRPLRWAAGRTLDDGRNFGLLELNLP